jgi:hypothetical protein
VQYILQEVAELRVARYFGWVGKSGVKGVTTCYTLGKTLQDTKRCALKEPHPFSMRGQGNRGAQLLTEASNSLAL